MAGGAVSSEEDNAPSESSGANDSPSADACGLYGTLGVSPDATVSEITAGFLRKAIPAHPHYGGDARSFRVVVRAFDLLLSKRERYDEFSMDCAFGDLQEEVPVDVFDDARPSRGNLRFPDGKAAAEGLPAKVDQLAQAIQCIEDPADKSDVLNGLPLPVKQVLQRHMTGRPLLDIDLSAVPETPASHVASTEGKVRQRGFKHWLPLETTDTDLPVEEEDGTEGDGDEIDFSQSFSAGLFAHPINFGGTFQMAGVVHSKCGSKYRVKMKISNILVTSRWTDALEQAVRWIAVLRSIRHSRKLEGESFVQAWRRLSAEFSEKYKTTGALRYQTIYQVGPMQWTGPGTYKIEEAVKFRESVRDAFLQNGFAAAVQVLKNVPRAKARRQQEDALKEMGREEVAIAFCAASLGKSVAAMLRAIDAACTQSQLVARRQKAEDADARRRVFVREKRKKTMREIMRLGAEVFDRDIRRESLGVTDWSTLKKPKSRKMPKFRMPSPKRRKRPDDRKSVSAAESVTDLESACSSELEEDNVVDNVSGLFGFATSDEDETDPAPVASVSPTRDPSAATEDPDAPESREPESRASSFSSSDAGDAAFAAFPESPLSPGVVDRLRGGSLKPSSSPSAASPLPAQTPLRASALREIVDFSDESEFSSEDLKSGFRRPRLSPPKMTKIPRK